ncbi:hypothetical protein MSG28_011435 [Choristoneura fumiferana]|uniref:Uncharacterized protein n=1 Tax=Choristoneura fumiferana TaxID=7141 RepID=A0ACC0JN93_CHOFU|nr:hypothetical protein MSG28_011435 [Choristoneura fumiferana]
MATVEGRPAQYGVSLRQLRELMETRGAEGMAKINALGGPQDICKKLYTSPTDGESKFQITATIGARWSPDDFSKDQNQQMKDQVSPGVR